MRQITFSTMVTLSVLAPSLGFAIGNYSESRRMDEKNSNGGSSRSFVGQSQNSKQNHKNIRNQLESARKAAFKKAYGELSEADKKQFGDIVTTAVGEDLAHVNKYQLIGFMGFVKANPTASCSVKNATKEDMAHRFSLLSGKTKTREDRIDSRVDKRDGTQIRPALMCTAGDKKMLFVGLPAATLNKYYNTNIMLASESAPAETTTGVVVTETQPVTGYASYISQSVVDAQPERDPATAFGFAPASIKATSEDAMHFSNDPAANK